MSDGITDAYRAMKEEDELKKLSKLKSPEDLDEAADFYANPKKYLEKIYAAKTQSLTASEIARRQEQANKATQEIYDRTQAKEQYQKSVLEKEWIKQLEDYMKKQQQHPNRPHPPSGPPRSNPWINSPAPNQEPRDVVIAREMLQSFKEGHPDFDKYQLTMRLFLEFFPQYDHIRNAFAIPLVYEMGKRLYKLIEDSVKEEFRRYKQDEDYVPITSA